MDEEEADPPRAKLAGERREIIKQEVAAELDHSGFYSLRVETIRKSITCSNSQLRVNADQIRRVLKEEFGLTYKQTENIDFIERNSKLSTRR